MELLPPYNKCERSEGMGCWERTILHLSRIVNAPDSGNVEIEVQQLHIKACFLGQVSHFRHCTAETIKSFSLVHKVLYHPGYL